MASYKVRRLMRPVGGLIAGAFNVSTAGALTIGAYGVSATGVVTSGSEKFGSVGNTVSKMLFGTSVVTAISCGAASSGSANITVANLALGDKVFVTPASMAACTFMSGACATAASVLSFMYQNAGSAAMADAPLTISYFAIS